MNYCDLFEFKMCNIIPIVRYNFIMCYNLLLYNASVIRLHLHKVPAIKTTTPLPHLWAVVWVSHSGSVAESSIGNYQTGSKTNVLWSLALALSCILRLGLLEELKWQDHRWKSWLNEDTFIKTSFKLEILFWKLN